MVKGSALIFALALFILAQAVSARTITVGALGADTRSICEAIRIASNDDRIVVKKGTYREPEIVVDKRLFIVGDGWPVIDGGNAHQVMVVKSNGATISGFVIANTGISHIDDRAGLRFDNVDGGTVEHCVFLNDLFAVYFAHSRNCRVLNNRIAGSATLEGSSGNGIHLWYCTNMSIKDNLISLQRDGIYLEFVSDSTIANNTCENNLRYGLHFMYSNNDKYAGNTFSRNGAGVAVMYSQNVNMARNTFLNNWGAASYGLLIKDLKNSKVCENMFMRNTIGLQCDNINRLAIEKNNFIGNGHAVKITSFCSESVFQHNNFVGNSFDLVTGAALQACKFKENFWDSNDGFDLNRDGIADCAYQPVKLSSWLLEHYPSASMLLRSPLFDLLDLSEKALPVLSTESLSDARPLMRRVQWKTPSSK